MKIGFIGTGVMGQGMIRHLKGHEVYIHNRTKKKAEQLIQEGARWCSTPVEVVKNSEIIFTMLWYPADVEELYLGNDGLIQAASNGQIFIDCTTSSPELAEHIAEEAQKQQVAVLDAPVSGGDIGAKNGTLSVMVGGNEQTFLKVRPIIDLFSGSVQYFGRAGSGQHTKMANQIAIASNMIGVAESLYYAERAGLNVERVLETISKGAAGSWSLTNLAPRMVKEDFEPGFYTHHFLKDMKIALEEAEKMDITLPGLKMAYEMYNRLSDDEKKQTGTHVIIQEYRRNQ